MTTLKELSIKHPYYSSDSNYYSNEASHKYNTFKEFYSEWHDADVDMNLVFRYDILLNEKDNTYHLQIFIIQQRKGIYKPIFVESIIEEDVPNLLSYLQPHINRLKEMWKPLEF